MASCPAAAARSSRLKALRLTNARPSQRTEWMRAIASAAGRPMHVVSRPAVDSFDWGSGREGLAGFVCRQSICRSLVRTRAVSRGAGPWGARETSSRPLDGEEDLAPDQFCVVNFYYLISLAQPEAEQRRHRGFVDGNGLDLRGRIYVSSQGVNAQYSGPHSDAMAYAKWLSGRAGFERLRWHIWKVNGHQFPKLRIKLRKALVQLAGGTEHLPLTNNSKRATPLEPGQWRKMLESSTGEKPVIIDVRNNYEFDAGHFKGAARPVEENFCETPRRTASGDQLASGKARIIPEPLKGVDKDTPVMMYCTGGIRCDVYSAYLQEQGFTKLYTLEGGIANYLKQEGPASWDGSLFVFDDRLAIGPDPQQPKRLIAASESAAPLPSAVPCQLCSQAQAVLPHLNCANVLCNKLFIACEACQSRYSSCCCTKCTRAPRLRFRNVDGNWEEKLQEVEDETEFRG